MLPQIRDWAKIYLDAHKPSTVLDIGSYDINGSMRVDAERYGTYVGLDMRQGPNVDIVANGHEIPFDDGYFDCVLCLETLEHDDYPHKTLAEIYRVLRHGGLLVVTVPGLSFPKHDFPNDYWRVTEDGLKVWLRRFRDVEVREILVERFWASVQGAAIK